VRAIARYWRESWSLRWTGFSRVRPVASPRHPATALVSPRARNLNPAVVDDCRALIVPGRRLLPEPLGQYLQGGDRAGLGRLGGQAECGADARPWQIVDHRHLKDGKPISLEIRRYGLQPAGADELGIVGRTRPRPLWSIVCFELSGCYPEAAERRSKNWRHHTAVCRLDI